MKKLTKEEMKTIYGGLVSPVQSECGVNCGGGKSKSVDCGYGVNCVSDSSTQTVWCDNLELCPCDTP